MQTTNLPFNLQLKGGQFFAAFGRLNPVHPHAWDFVDDPLVNGLFLGPDGLRGVGAQTSWTLPLPWYSQLIFASQNGRGSTGFSFRNPGDDGMFFDRVTTDREARGLQDFVWIPRFENSFNLSDTQTSQFTDDLDRQSRWRLSANLTWYPTEFSKIRLQYNQDFLEENFFLSAQQVESVFLQWEFILGAHGAHKF